MSHMGERLRELRLQRRLSQEEVARHLGITRSAYSHYEINNRQPVYETLIKLASLFNVSLDYIIGGGKLLQKSDRSETQDATEILQLFRHMDPEQRSQSIRMIRELLHKHRRDNGEEHA